MTYPIQVRLRDLERTHNDYELYRDAWQTLDDFRQGPAIVAAKAAHYLPRRPGEPAEAYNHRLSKFVYTPVVATAIREFVSELVSAPLYLEGTQGPWWTKWLTRIDGYRMDLTRFVTEVFSHLLFFGRVYVSIDTPRGPGRSLAESSDPYILIYPATQVINWGEGWYLSRQVAWRTEPLEEPKQVLQFTYWCRDGIRRYEWTKGAYAQLVAEVPTSECRMVCLQVPGYLWAGNNLYLKQLEHLWIESAWVESGSVAGIVQRIFTPQAPVALDDPRVLYQAPELPKFDSQHILVGQDYRVVESTGAALGSLQSQLDTIERQVRHLVSMGYARDAQATSGLSKEYDRSIQEYTMRDYGLQVVQLVQAVFQVVARSAGMPDDISCQGLDSYSLDNLGSMVDITGKLIPFADGLPQTTQKVWVSKLSRLMTGTLSRQDEQQLAQELEDIYQAKGDVSPDTNGRGNLAGDPSPDDRDDDQ